MRYLSKSPSTRGFCLGASPISFVLLLPVKLWVDAAMWRPPRSAERRVRRRIQRRRTALPPSGRPSSRGDLASTPQVRAMVTSPAPSAGLGCNVASGDPHPCGRRGLASLQPSHVSDLRAYNKLFPHSLWKSRPHKMESPAWGISKRSFRTRVGEEFKKTAHVSSGSATSRNRIHFRLIKILAALAERTRQCAGIVDHRARPVAVLAGGRRHKGQPLPCTGHEGR